jgi:tetratricopeptide (TPR) repeat protein
VLARAQLGELYLAKGRIRDALNEWLEVLKLEPANLQALHNVGAIYTDLKMYDEAIDVLERAERLGSTAPLLFYNKGLCYLGKGEHAKAIEALTKAKELEPESTVTITTLGEAYAMSGDTDSAMAQWEEVLQANPDDLFATYNLGLAYLEKNQVDKAVEMWEKCKTLNPAYLPARQNLATLAVNAGNFDKAIDEWTAISLMDPANPQPQMVLGDLYYRSGKMAESRQITEELLDKLAQVEPKDKDSRKLRSDTEFLYGTVLIASGNPGDGLDHWVKAMNYNPNFALESSGFISRAIWPELIQFAGDYAKTEDHKKVLSLVNSFVKEDAKPPKGVAPVPKLEERGKVGFRWFSRGKK